MLLGGRIAAVEARGFDQLFPREPSPAGQDSQARSDQQPLDLRRGKLSMAKSNGAGGTGGGTVVAERLIAKLHVQGPTTGVESM